MIKQEILEMIEQALLEIHLDAYADDKGITLDEALECYRRGLVQIDAVNGDVVVSETHAMKC
jgi:hypothetical protein